MALGVLPRGVPAEVSALQGFDFIAKERKGERTAGLSSQNAYYRGEGTEQHTQQLSPILQVLAIFPLVRFTTPAALKPALAAALIPARAKLALMKASGVFYVCCREHAECISILEGSLLCPELQKMCSLPSNLSKRSAGL